MRLINALFLFCLFGTTGCPRASTPLEPAADAAEGEAEEIDHPPKPSPGAGAYSTGAHLHFELSIPDPCLHFAEYDRLSVGCIYYNLKPKVEHVLPLVHPENTRDDTGAVEGHAFDTIGKQEKSRLKVYNYYPYKMVPLPTNLLFDIQLQRIVVVSGPLYGYAGAIEELTFPGHETRIRNTGFRREWLVLYEGIYYNVVSYRSEGATEIITFWTEVSAPGSVDSESNNE